MITSTANSRVKRVVQLQEKSKARLAEGVFVAEGIKMFLEAPLEQIEEVYLTEALAGRNPEVLGKVRQCQWEMVTEEIFQRMSDTRTPQGVLCVMKRFHYKLTDLLKPDALLVILEDIQDPGNLGTILRTGEGAGITGVIMSRDTVDIYNPKTIRSTMGSLYRMPFVYTENLGETIEKVKRSGITVYAAHLKGKKDYDACDYTQASAFLIGNEGNGLTDVTAAMADTYIRIPMAGQVESLNAAVATSILMYEAARRRRMEW